MNPIQQSEADQLKDRAYSRKEVVDIIRSVLGTVGKDNEATSKLYDELSALAGYIDNMRSELAQLRSVEINSDHIPIATDELDAVVEETATATNKIMTACEDIENVANTLAAPTNEILANAVTSVYEACGFQDLTGQRITKVVRTLKHIESKMSDILAAFGQAPGQERKAPIDNKSLTNGPQLKGMASSQEDIDKLLSSFDK